MMSRDYLWKQVPFLRLLVPFCTGIICGYYTGLIFPVSVLIPAVFLFFFIYRYLSSYIKYRLRFLPGVFVFIIFHLLGSLAVYREDIRNDRAWFGNQSPGNAKYLAVIIEPLSVKQGSYKAVASVSNVGYGGKSVSARGKLIIYFSKELKAPLPGYGCQVVFSKKPGPVQRSGNPFAFDYSRYCLFQGITHQVYLEEKDFKILPEKKETFLKKFIFDSKQEILSIIRKYIPGKIESGLAEALLIGYKDDLDKDLVTSYSNTGVVHIIAISGLHLGLIYWLLGLMLYPFKLFKRLRWPRSLIIIGGLWIFTLLAGAQPSILRSAVMFTCIVLGESLRGRTNIYNTMAVSAFILLCINPFWLWDAGFQLSYAAVLSIIVFMKPVYNLYYTSGKLLDVCWKMNAVTISAQVLTIPICIYHFHQFPNLFLLTNFVAVPLSSLVLLGEIGLCAISMFSPVASIAGNCISWLIGRMNDFVRLVEAMPFSSWKSLQVTFLQVILLYVFIVAAALTFTRAKAALYTAMISLFLFAIARSISFYNAYSGKMIIVYNIPGNTAIDFVSGRRGLFAGDNEVISNASVRAFHIDPARTGYRYQPSGDLEGLHKKNGLYDFHGFRVMIAPGPFTIEKPEQKEHIDLLVVCGKAFPPLSQVVVSMDIKTVLVCGSAGRTLSARLKKECDSLRINFYDARVKGAFVKIIP